MHVFTKNHLNKKKGDIIRCSTPSVISNLMKQKVIKPCGVSEKDGDRIKIKKLTNAIDHQGIIIKENEDEVLKLNNDIVKIEESLKDAEVLYNDRLSKLGSEISATKTLLAEAEKEKADCIAEIAKLKKAKK